MVIQIRPYHQSDWQRLCEIHDAARLDELSSTTASEAFKTLEQAYEEDGLFDASLMVAIVNNGVTGFIAYTADEVTWLYVSPDQYRNGVGRARLQHALANTADTVTLEVLEGNTAALGLYESLGFQIKERVEGKLSGNESFPATGLVMECNKTR